MPHLIQRHTSHTDTSVRGVAFLTSSLFTQICFYFTCVICLQCVSVYHIHAWCLERSEENLGSPGTELHTDDCESPVSTGNWTCDLYRAICQYHIITLGFFSVIYFTLVSLHSEKFCVPWLQNDMRWDGVRKELILNVLCLIVFSKKKH